MLAKRDNASISILCHMEPGMLQYDTYSFIQSYHPLKLKEPRIPERSTRDKDAIRPCRSNRVRHLTRLMDIAVRKNGNTCDLFGLCYSMPVRYAGVSLRFRAAVKSDE